MGKATKKQKNRLIILILMVCLALNVLPSGVFAQEMMITSEALSKVGIDMFMWPNESGKYEYAYPNAQVNNKYMIVVIPGIYTSLDGIDLDQMADSILYINQQTASNENVYFGFIPREIQNSTVIFGGDGIEPMIAGYISTDIFTFGGYYEDAQGNEILNTSYLANQNASWEEVKGSLPTAAYVGINSEYFDTIYVPVSLTWSDGTDFDSSTVGRTSRAVSKVQVSDYKYSANLGSIMTDFSALITIQDNESSPMYITASKDKVVYQIGEQITDDDVVVRVVFRDGTVRKVTGWTSNVSSLSSASKGIQTLTISYTENRQTISTDISLRITDSAAEDTVYRIDFNTNGGTRIATQFVEKGNQLVLPEDPVKNGYEFAGWYTDRKLQELFSENTLIERNMVLYAGWIDVTVPVFTELTASLSANCILQGETVTQDMLTVTAHFSDGSSTVVTDYESDFAQVDQTTAGTKIIHISYRQGLVTKRCEVSFRVVKANRAERYTVTFDTGCDVPVAPQMVVAGDKINKPLTELVKANYRFTGWYYGATEWDFDNNIVSQDMTLKAKWVKRYLYSGDSDDNKLYAYVEDIEDIEYTGNAIKPNLIVMDDQFNVLKAGTDYTVSYENNILPSTDTTKAKIIITGKKNYAGTIQIPFEIKAKNLSDDETVKLTFKTVYNYNAKGYKPVPTAKYLKKKLALGKDFDVQYMKLETEGSDSGAMVNELPIISAGYYRVTLTGKGNYTGSRSIDFVIGGEKARNLSSASISIDKQYKNISYTGKAVDIASGVTVKVGKEKLEYGKDYTIQYPENATDIGKITATVKALPNNMNYFGEKNFAFSITGVKISSAKVNLTEKKIKYTGDLNNDNISSVTIKVNEAQAQAINAYRRTSLSKGDTYTLVEGTDYAVSYSNNIKPGKASVVVKGIGVFTGTKKATFTIDKISLANNDAITFTTVGKSVRQNRAGAVIEPNVTYTVNGRVYTLQKGRDYTVSYANNTKASDTAVIKIKGIGNYTGTLKQNFTIRKKTILYKDIEVIVTNPLKVDKANYVYKPKVDVYDNGVKLKEKKDYILDYEDCVTQSDVAAGKTQGRILIVSVDKGSYTDSRSVPYSVVTRDIKKSNLSVSIADQTYTGKPITFDAYQKADRDKITAVWTLDDGSKETLTLGKDFEIVSYSKNTTCGNAQVVIRGKGAYTGTRKVKFKILQRSILSK